MHHFCFCSVLYSRKFSFISLQFCTSIGMANTMRFLFFLLGELCREKKIRYSYSCIWPYFLLPFILLLILFLYKHRCYTQTHSDYTDYWTTQIASLFHFSSSHSLTILNSDTVCLWIEYSIEYRYIFHYIHI